MSKLKTKNRKVHFIGIGGIGVSALARYYLEKGYKISGSDLISSEITNALKEKGAKLLIGKQKAKNLLRDVNLVIYSPAVPQNNPELKKAKKLKIKCLSYPQALGELTKKHFTIAIAGSHGKSTVAAMIGLLLTKAGFDPTVIIGTKLREFGDSNCRAGKSKYLIIEADEHFASFLNYWPKIIVLTTIETDHLDYYKNLKNIIKAFKKFVSHLPKNGILIANKDQENVFPIFSTNVKNARWYSLKNKESEKLRKILKIPGEHNVSNALATLTVARVLEIPDKISLKAISEYRGSWRRFDIIEANLRELKRGKTRKITIINDYAHHPTQVRVTLKAAREKFPKRKIFCIFQPHQYLRTYYLFDDFVKALGEAPVDKLIITDIYSVAGREKREIKRKVSSEKLVKEIKKKLLHKKATVASDLCKVKYIPSIGKVSNYLKKELEGGEVVIVMGAGDIYFKFNQYFDKIKKSKGRI